MRTILIESHYIADCHVKPLHLEGESDTAGQVVVCESSYLPDRGAAVFNQQMQAFIKGSSKTLKLDMRKSDAVEMDKRSLDVLALFGKGIGIDGVKGGQDRSPRRVKWLAHAQTLTVVKQLLEEVGASKDTQMVVQPPNVRRLVGSLTVPVSSNVPPGFSILCIAILNGHPVTAQIT